MHPGLHVALDKVASVVFGTTVEWFCANASTVHSTSIVRECWEGERRGMEWTLVACGVGWSTLRAVWCAAGRLVNGLNFLNQPRKVGKEFTDPLNQSN
jgi:hypothetical protein